MILYNINSFFFRERKFQKGCPSVRQGQCYQNGNIYQVILFDDGTETYKTWHIQIVLRLKKYGFIILILFLKERKTPRGSFEISFKNPERKYLKQIFTIFSKLLKCQW